MKKFLALTLATMSLSSFAATQADLVLKGTVAPILSISVSAAAAASSLDLSQAATDVAVGSVTEKSNSRLGYKVTAKSTNGGKLVNVDDSTSYVPYSLSYDGSAITLATTDSQIYSTSSVRGTKIKDLLISFNKPSDLAAGSHEDTVTFTIVAN